VAEPLLRGFRLAHILDCLVDPTKVRVVAELSDDVSAALPYLATILPQAGYNHAAHVLNLVEGGRLVTVYPRVVMLAKASDAADARAVLEWLRELINDAWARRGEIEPCLERRRTARLFALYPLLPRTNCGACGEPTCLAFAARLVFRERGWRDCPALAGEEYARQRVVLAEWVGERTESEHPAPKPERGA
jgi:ArsR family metal-binding transcriptional regulator